MNPVRVVIADDEEGMRLIMRRMLQKSGDFELMGEAKDGEELLSLVEEHHPQLVLLDVEMPIHSGVECARVIQDTDPSIVLVFATAHDQYMADAFSVYAFDYLLKPFKLDRALKTLERVKSLMAEREAREPCPSVESSAKTPGRLMLKHREGVNFVGMSDILLVQREERSTVLYTADGNRYVTSESLGDMEKRLDPSMFFRCHKSYIINLNHIDNITPYGRWTYIVRLRGTKHDALITHEKYEELERLFA
ncbi:MAG TPA: LytTR family DNA-binding domain-containing protein [Clostridia bacterium]|nr:LytTR family DNA-binding domain-containing protein [Clostridia bacterium]